MLDHGGAGRMCYPGVRADGVSYAGFVDGGRQF
jgi:hypothetical protein